MNWPALLMATLAVVSVWNVYMMLYRIPAVHDLRRKLVDIEHTYLTDHPGAFLGEFVWYHSLPSQWAMTYKFWIPMDNIMDGMPTVQEFYLKQYKEKPNESNNERASAN